MSAAMRRAAIEVAERLQKDPPPHRAKPEPGDVVLVEWVDSWSVHGWEFPKNIHPDSAVHCQTAGFLLRDDATGVHIVSTRHAAGDGSVAQHIGIPRQSIKSVKFLFREKP